ncbi:hypothetical protein ABZP36_024878 [Zizania latifolia]
MSRCFPFPPPGYVAKPRSEHKDLLKKEKHKERKHKKEKGRRERKAKNGDHRKDKHGKKHKREKHKDKRKNKDKDRDKSQTLEKEAQRNRDPDNGRSKERVQNEAVKDIKPANEVVAQILDQEGDAVHTSNSTSKLLPRSTKNFGSAGSKEKKMFCGNVVEKSRRTTHLEHGMVQKNYNIAYDNGKGKDAGFDPKTQVQNGKTLQVISVQMHSNRRQRHRRMGLPQKSADDTSTITTVVPGARGAINGIITLSPEQVDHEPVGSSRSPCGKSGSISPRGLMEIKNESDNNFHIRMYQQLARNKDRTVEGKPKTEELKTNDHKTVEDKYRDWVVKKREPKYKNKDKEKVRKVVNNQEHDELDSLEPSKNKKDGLMQLGCLNEKFTSDDVKKKKDVEANSSLLEHSRRMNKLPRISPTNPPANGKILRHYWGSGTSSSTVPVPVGTNTYEVDRFQDSKECYNNGITGSYHLKEPKISVSSSNYRSNQVSLKPPHPDSKYLSQVYSVPTMDDFSGCIDQGWLLSRDRIDSKSEILEDAQSPQVWAEAQLIDYANVFALPYVVPL